MASIARLDAGQLLARTRRAVASGGAQPTSPSQTKALILVSSWIQQTLWDCNLLLPVNSGLRTTTTLKN